MIAGELEDSDEVDFRSSWDPFWMLLCSFDFPFFFFLSIFEKALNTDDSMSIVNCVLSLTIKSV